MAQPDRLESLQKTLANGDSAAAAAAAAATPSATPEVAGAAGGTDIAIDEDLFDGDDEDLDDLEDQLEDMALS